MTTESTCPNGRWLLAEWERLQAQGESLRAQWEEARKRIAALEAEVRRGRRLKELEAKRDARVAEERRFAEGDHERFIRRLRKGGPSASSHRAERALRPAVLVCKTGAVTDPSKGPNSCDVGQPASNPEATGTISVRTAPRKPPLLFPPRGGHLMTYGPKQVPPPFY
jgi:hypothetical protein